MAQQFVERHALEAQIDLSGQKGKAKQVGDTMNIEVTDPFSIFANIKGTPKYWQKARNQLCAKVEGLGPFHVFFTFSCGEMRWSEVFVAVLEKKGYNIEYMINDGEDDWNGSDENILVNGEKLWDFVDKQETSKHQFLKDHTFDITIQFDERVKSFIRNILLGKGKEHVPFQYYMYRVEFQARGLPHIHGVAWIDKDWLEKRALRKTLLTVLKNLFN